ncbi:MAG: hypothetical protein M3220_05430 [Chloroflexota bacterium]|nr:hypothetical protein [Chloroflexota bacterium]
MEVISTKVHGVLDYLAAALLLLLPWMVEWNPTVETLLLILGAGLLVYSLLTRYELGVWKVIPMGVHLVLDGLAGLILLGAAFALDDLDSGAFWVLILFGLLELGAALLTEREWVPPEEATIER